MKKDILKEFVSENREDFDDQEPGADVLGKIQFRLGLEPPAATPRSKIIRVRYWRAAAAIILVMAGFALFFRQTKTKEPLIAHETKPRPATPAHPADRKDSITPVPPVLARIADPEQKKAVVKRQQQTGHKNTAAHIDPGTETVAAGAAADDWRKELQSESASARLAAVLACGKSNALLSDSDLRILSHTMNNDENGNVRLAALGVLKKQDNQMAVKDMILQSVAKQDDPVVQMELLASLSSDEATKMKQQLLDITQNPINIDAVRNEAYAALLRSKSNF